MQDPPRDPDTARDTIPIRPLRKWASRLFITAALVAAAALGVLAARMMGDMASNPDIQQRYETLERMREQGGRPDEAPPVDSTATGPDSTSAADGIRQRPEENAKRDGPPSP